MLGWIGHWSSDKRVVSVRKSINWLANSALDFKKETKKKHKLINFIPPPPSSKKRREKSNKLKIENKIGVLRNFYWFLVQ